MRYSSCKPTKTWNEQPTTNIRILIEVSKSRFLKFLENTTTTVCEYPAEHSKTWFCRIFGNRMSLSREYPDAVCKSQFSQIIEHVLWRNSSNFGLMEQCPSQKAYSNQLKLTTDNLCLASNLSIPGEQQKTEWAPNIVIKYYYLPPLLMSLSFLPVFNFSSASNM